MAKESPLLIPLAELKRKGKINQQDANRLRRQVNANFQALLRLAGLLDDTVESVLERRRGYLTCYARGRHLFLDLQGSMAESGEFYIAAARRDCYIMEDVCAECGTRRQVKLDKKYLDRIGRPAYYRPSNFDLMGVHGYAIGRGDAIALLTYDRFEQIIRKLQGRRLRVVSG